MLLATNHARHVSMTEYEGQIVLSVRKRAGWELEDVTSELGQEGVWYIADDLDRAQRPLKPIASEGPEPIREAFYQLRPESRTRVHLVHRHRFLVRWWNDDIYVPRMDTSVYTLVEHGTQDGVVWELVTPSFTLYGVQV